MSHRLLGARARRSHDPRLLTGKGAYVDDLRIEGVLHLAMWRSPLAHARITRIDFTRALSVAGVIDAFDITAFGASPPTFPVVVSHESLRECPQFPLARERVRHVGEGVAVVIAESRAVAEDALEEVEVSLEALPAVASVEAATSADAPLLHETAPANICAEFTLRIGDVDAAFATADVVVSERLEMQRAKPVSRSARRRWRQAQSRSCYWCERAVTAAAASTRRRTRHGRDDAIPRRFHRHPRADVRKRRERVRRFARADRQRTANAEAGRIHRRLTRKVAGCLDHHGATRLVSGHQVTRQRAQRDQPRASRRRRSMRLRRPRAESVRQPHPPAAPDAAACAPIRERRRLLRAHAQRTEHANRTFEGVDRLEDEVQLQVRIGEQLFRRRRRMARASACSYRSAASRKRCCIVSAMAMLFSTCASCF